MAIYFVKQTAIVATPSDANDGKDPLGFGLVGASWTATTKSLVSPGAFVGYSHASGDCIYIESVSAGTDGWYTILSKDSDDQLTLGDLIHGAGIGSDQVDVTSSTGPFLTIGYAVNQGGAGNAALAGGDVIRVCNDGTYLVSSLINIDTTAGDENNPISLCGFNARGSVRESVTLQATTNTVILNVGRRHWRIEWFDFDGNGSTADQLLAMGEEGHVYWRCRVFNHGSNIRRAIILWRSTIAMIECEVFNNAGVGVASGGGATYAILLACSVHDNAAAGISGHGTGVHNCLVYRNGSHGIETGSNASSRLINNTIYDNGGHGIVIDSGDFLPCIVNNTIVSNGGFGIEFESNTPNYQLCDFNHYHDNALGQTNLPITPGDSNVTGDPMFASTTPGSEDFTPQVGSPLVGAGLDAGER